MAFTPQPLPSYLSYATPSSSSSSSTRPRAVPPSHAHELEITSQDDCFIALSHSDALCSNPAYVRAILRSYTQCKILHKTATGTARGGQDYVDLWAVGKKLDALERLLILKGFTSLSLQILQTRSHFSLPLTDPKLPSSQNPSLVNPNPSSASPSSQRSIPYSNSSGLDAARIQIFPNGPPMRVSRALPRGAGASETRGTMEGVDVDRAGVVRESVPAAGEGAEGGGDVLPQYERLGDGVAVGEDEDVPGYVRGTGEVPGYV